MLQLHGCSALIGLSRWTGAPEEEGEDPTFLGEGREPALGVGGPKTTKSGWRKVHLQGRQFSPGPHTHTAMHTHALTPFAPQSWGESAGRNWWALLKQPDLPTELKVGGLPSHPLQPAPGRGQTPCRQGSSLPTCSPPPPHTHTHPGQGQGCGPQSRAPLHPLPQRPGRPLQPGRERQLGHLLQGGREHSEGKVPIKMKTLNGFSAP